MTATHARPRQANATHAPTIRPPKRADIYPWWVWVGTPALVVLAVGAMILAR
jgi:hypothetical protein